MRDFSRWLHYRKDALPDEREWIDSFSVMVRERLTWIERVRKTRLFRLRRWFRRKFLWRA